MNIVILPDVPGAVFGIILRLKCPASRVCLPFGSFGLHLARLKFGHCSGIYTFFFEKAIARLRNQGVAMETHKA